MGCGTSRGQTTPRVSTPRAFRVDNDNWMYYAPRHKYEANHCCSHCGQPNRSGYTICSVSDYADGQSSTPTRSGSSWGSDEGPPYSPRSPCSNRSYIPPLTPVYSSPVQARRRPYSNRSYTPPLTPTFASPYNNRSCTAPLTPTYSSPGQTSGAIYTPRPRASPLQPLIGPASSATFTSRTYSPVSTPIFPSPSSHPRHGLALDPTLFSNTMSPFAQAACANKIDTDCASRFSGTSGSLSAFTSPTSSRHDVRYPLTPLSVHTEPFPKARQEPAI